MRFCPRCGREADIVYPHRLTCPHCGYGAYYNPSPVASVIPLDVRGDILLARRGNEPGRGRWSMPGGFVDLGESVEDAARRELKEELDLEIELLGLVGVYSKPEDRIVLIVFTARAHGTPRTSEEALEVRAFPPSAIPWDELAFWNDTCALRDHLRAREEAGDARAVPPARTSAMDTEKGPVA